MDWDALFGILFTTTVSFRKNDAEIHRNGIRVAETDMLLHLDEASPDLELVDVVLFIVGVDRAKAVSRRDELIEVLWQYPQPETLDGISYIAVGKEIGSDAAALQLFALGSVLGLWQLVTPAGQGVSEAEALQMASNGMVKIVGYTPPM